MAKSSPEKLARALRVNLKRRKQTKPIETKEPPPESAAGANQKPPKAED
jgi:hypothetical protein